MFYIRNQPLKSTNMKDISGKNMNPGSVFSPNMSGDTQNFEWEGTLKYFPRVEGIENFEKLG